MRVIGVDELFKLLYITDNDNDNRAQCVNLYTLKEIIEKQATVYDVDKSKLLEKAAVMNENVIFCKDCAFHLCCSLREDAPKLKGCVGHGKTDKYQKVKLTIRNNQC